MTLVLGIDSSTQSTKALLTDAETGTVVAEGRAAHPDGTEVDPHAWWQACQEAISQATAGSTERVAAVAVAGQQHGMVTLDAAGEVVRPALLWNDTRSAGQARRLVEDGAGPAWWAEQTGSVPVASFTVTKLAWLAENEPANADRVAAVALPHDWLTWRLAGRGDRLVTDRGDASGTGYFSPRTGAWLPEVLDTAFGGRRPRLPDVLGPNEPAGTTTEGAVLAPGTGDNMAAALGLDLRPGDVVVSLGTSGTVFASVPTPAADPSGLVAGFCDATGRYLPLVCTLNAARVLTSTAAMLGTDLAGLDALALRAAPGSGGLVMLPYLEGERTPDLPNATGTLVGLRGTNMSPENLARAAVEGMLCGLADGLAALRDTDVEVRRVLLIGGASRSGAVRAVAAGLFGVPVDLPDPDEYVALGAARQAAWVVSGDPAPPDWRRPTQTLDPTGDGAEVHNAYSAARKALYGS
ncbi:xylulokinase [Actinophytocola sp.]|uniref:xylulokinase n=1 Tax=Actinophytocola sp. TaxID=1872138 RepID=UPI002D80BC26|nr:xylulokinase [Actinophytocola sp.]HET9138269.1 xylulokinase [Actinophytocola sp.]